MTTENCNATVNVPPVGYHTLKFLEGLKMTFRDTNREISRVGKLKEPMDYEKCARIENLKKFRSQILAEFEHQRAYVEKWVSQFPDKYALYGDIITKYYCDINTAFSLQDIIDEILIEDDDKNRKSNRLQAKIRTMTLNQIQNQ